MLSREGRALCAEVERETGLPAYWALPPFSAFGSDTPDAPQLKLLLVMF